MMKILLPLLILSAPAFADEEAIILNQELQFLEESARDLRLEARVNTEDSAKSPEEVSLERTYFSDSERDEIRTKAAAPRRVRGF